MYTIDKEFNWEMGHRVWSQKLDSKYSIDNLCKCRFYHGHGYRAKIGLKTESLKNGMVTDFKHFNFIKEIIDNYFDHKFMIDKNDPNLNMVFPQYKNLEGISYDGFFEYFKAPQNSTELEKEHIEAFVVVDFVPTSENICKMLYKLIHFKMQDLLKVEGCCMAFVELWETPKSHCRYTND